MCAPLAVLAPIFAIGATAFSAVSQISQANAQAKSANATAANNQKIANYNAKVQENSATMQDAAATDALNRGANDAATIKQNVRKANATARATAAGTGLLADTGTYGDIQDQNSTTGALDALTAGNNAEREAYGYKVQAQDMRNQATNTRLQGEIGVNNAQYQSSVIKQGGLLNATGTLITGASKFASDFKTPSSTALTKKAS